MNTKLRVQLIARYRAQRAMYLRAHRDPSFWDSRLLQSHYSWLASIVQKIGWPAISLVGEDGAQAAWQLLQVADGYPEFQQQCLELMKKMPAGEVRQYNIAYLEDRIRSRQGMPQLYGTQHGEGASLIIDRGNLDRRRRAMGLVPYEDEVRQVESLGDQSIA